jgi:hypothetical protein
LCGLSATSLSFHDDHLIIVEFLEKLWYLVENRELLALLENVEIPRAEGFARKRIDWVILQIVAKNE